MFIVQDIAAVFCAKMEMLVNLRQENADIFESVHGIVFQNVHFFLRFVRDAHFAIFVVVATFLAFHFHFVQQDIARHDNQFAVSIILVFGKALFLDFFFAKYRCLQFFVGQHSCFGLKLTIDGDESVSTTFAVAHLQVEILFAFEIEQEIESAVFVAHAVAVLRAAVAGHPHAYFHVFQWNASENGQNLAVQKYAFFDGMFQFEIFRMRHFLPIVTTPALHHHQQIQSPTMSAIVFFEIPGRLMNIAFQIGSQQQLTENIVMGMIGHVFRIIADGNGKTLMGQCYPRRIAILLQSQSDMCGFESVVYFFVLFLCNADLVGLVGFVANEKQARTLHLSLVVQDQNFVDTGGQHSFG